MLSTAHAGSEKVGMLVKTSLVDYPGHVAAAVFLHGCNLRCPYCYNTDLVTGTLPEDAATYDEIMSHLEKRRRVIQGFVISGGEALLSPWTPQLIHDARSLGYLIKLDTNGMAPGKLEALLQDPSLCPDFVALDVKTAPDKYAALLPQKSFDEQGRKALADSITESIRLVSSLPANRREFRTVLVPPLVGEQDILDISALLPSDASWQFAGFRNDHCVDPLYQNVAPYLSTETEALLALAKKNVTGAALR
ncbi:MAG: anaerobic ribonucleoside-triphosphate reductase activating protein [Treponemataceae bacterium]|nr:anaerobic ribonucleoside-triphosphate reductase activating protein [Treponemataceae bacterium]